MVKVFEYLYTGPTIPNFLENGKKYAGRVNKNGNTMAKNEKGQWIIVEDYRLTISRMKKYFEIRKISYVKNHKEAIAFDLV